MIADGVEGDGIRIAVVYSTLVRSTHTFLRCCALLTPTPYVLQIRQAAALRKLALGMRRGMDAAVKPRDKAPSNRQESTRCRILDFHQKEERANRCE